MENLKLCLGLIGNVISVLVFASPIKTFWRIVKRRSTEDFESIPYVCTLLSSLMWTYYGVTKPGGLLIATVNTVGIVLEAIYVALFLLYAPPAMKARTAVLAAILDVGFFGGVVLVTRLAVHGGARVSVIGAICTGLSMCMYGSPLAAMKTVINTKSVEYMPFLLSFFLFLNGGVWTAYAVLDRDVFLGLPNGIGFILGTTQLVLYALYMDSKVSKQMSLATEDEQRKCLIDPIEREVDVEEGINHT